MNKDYESVILFDKLFNYNEYYDEILIKKSSIPIILTDNNSKNIIIIKNSELEKIYNSEYYNDTINDIQNVINLTVNGNIPNSTNDIEMYIYN